MKYPTETTVREQHLYSCSIEN